ncbi:MULTISPECIES: UDP-galactopyranose mutase [Methanosphaera]|uniref:UDP-galactopyranose mutase n=1 Tax=Methanosphaera TaxID=2316 RepID=UPI000DC37EB6|nr:MULTISPECIES: UDP-galactopyranose mutase [Methanosphaera]MDO5821992.1 UDP-galactopyranose mutase [Methanosphaera sp.]MEE0489549.1 UDP-galactopyranose mutase [Methanosphaera stadtmanae]RAP48804.1 MAG: UDP-galactopyranose mutase [Methanosphaera sp. DEW79]
MEYDYIIVGAGITGITAAEQLANVYDKKVLLIDKNDHIGGNCYDYYDESGILVHKYGPHIFHTNNEEVYSYLSLFTTWNVYNHKLVCNINNTVIPVPFNLISIDKTMQDDNQKITTALLTEYIVNDTLPLDKLKESKNPDIQKLVSYVNENIYTPYVKKIYGVDPEKICEVDGVNINITISYDCRYYQDKYQAVPSNGYTSMFENMLSNHNINILLEHDYNDIISIDLENKKVYFNDEEYTGQLIFTGMIDEFFNYCYGKLPYRSIVYMNETVDQIHFQENASIIYPNDYHFTEITEYKYITGQHARNTTIQFAFPTDYNPKYDETNIPYYPIITEENMELFRKYEKLTEKFPQITFMGRLCNYKHLNMDEAVQNVHDVLFRQLKHEIDEEYI